MSQATIKKKFKISDTYQQMVGGILLSGPFIVTEEVWRNIPKIMDSPIIIAKWPEVGK